MTGETTTPIAAERDNWLYQLVNCSDCELAQRDIAELHLFCARGLPGTGDLDVSACLQQLDDWTALVRVGIGNALRNRAKFPEFDELSEPEYQVVAMFSVLYRHLGLTLNVQFNEDPYDGSDARDLFVHAVLMDGYGATCCTAPIIFAAVGRRLGFPIKVVKTREHLFCRWDDGVDRFNIEATNRGYFRYSDDHYLMWPKPIIGTSFEKGLSLGVFLKNLSPREELALVLVQRGHCLLENLRIDDALKAYWAACQLDGNDPFHRTSWQMATLIFRALGESRTAVSRELPADGLRFPPPRKDWEASVHRAASHALNRIVSNLRKRSVAELPA